MEMPCVPCPDGEFSDSLNADRCLAWKAPCTVGEAEEAPTASSDRVCQQCPYGSYRSVGMSGCFPCTACEDGFHTSRQCSPTLVRCRGGACDCSRMVCEAPSSPLLILQ